MKQLNLETAKELLNKNMQNQNLRRHCYAVGMTLRAFYNYYKSQAGGQLFKKAGTLSADDWEITGILHDADWEITANDPNRHTIMLMDWLKDYETSEELLNVFRSHNTKHTHLREPETLLEWTLECCDELTGFIVAVTLVMPNKKLADVGVENILKKFKQKEFARAVDRTQIAQCKEKLNIDLDKFVEITLNAMKTHADILGL